MSNLIPVDTPGTDTLPFPIPQNFNDPNNPPSSSPLYLQTPPGLSTEVEYDPVTKQYYLKNKVGNFEVGSPYVMSMEEYMKWDMENSVSNYWVEKSLSSTKGSSTGGLGGGLVIPNKAFSTIFGSNTIEIRPQGAFELIFGVNSSKREDPALDVRQQRTTNFDFQEKIQMNVRAKIGEKIDFGINYNTEASFDFDNKMKLAYEGDEDDALQLIEAGDVTFPLSGTLIQGSQSLFGFKTKWKFGKTTVTSVFSQQKSETKNITVSGGALTQEFRVTADEYEENKHYFLSQYFYEHYSDALKTLPAINSPINITKIEVWVTTVGAPVEQNRNVIAFMDLAEPVPYRTDLLAGSGPGAYADNEANDLFTQVDINSIRNINTVSNYLSGVPFNMVSGRDYEKVENARKLNTNEYTFNYKLGFISLNSRLNADQVLAVAYQYTVVGSDKVYTVGEFSDGGVTAPNNLVVKLLKSTTVNTRVPTWKLMMKNVYSINAYQVNSEDFILNVVYESPEHGVPIGFLTEGAISGQPLIRALGLDNLNTQMDPTPDGLFDFINGAATAGGTVQATNGRIYFPVVEPFGLDLREAIDPSNPGSQLAYKYSFDSLYTTTKYNARQYPDKNRFIIEGRYKSSSGSDISLQSMNVPQGSVVVSAGGVPLREGVDYTVDYTLGRVKIINEGILSSGTPITISLENNSTFNVQTKTLLGAHVDYEVNKDFKLGGTIINLTEKPITTKVNTGDEPISNTLMGLDGSFFKETRTLTKLIDKLPLIETKEVSKVNITGEIATFIPGHPRALGSQGISYIDDFDGSTSGYDIGNMGQWFLSSLPLGQTTFDMFPEASFNNDTIASGFNRAKLAWYNVDPLFLRNNTYTPDYISADKDAQSNHYIREIYEKEVFPNKESTTSVPTALTVLNLAYYPTRRGPYNFDVAPTPFSAGIDADGNLNEPGTRWAGIMRDIETTDFEANNIEYIEFWLMDPFIDPDESGPMTGMQNGGSLYFNLGDISEDVLKDGRKLFENGLPTSTNVIGVDTTIWGRVPTLQALTNSFDNTTSSRLYQDVGYDGLGNNDERSFFQESYLDKIAAIFGNTSAAYINANNDPSADDYHYFRGTDYDNDELTIMERYELYNNTEGNSATPDMSDEDYSTAATTIPNVEDINRDNTLSEEERYYQYKVEIRPDKMEIGKNYISDIYEASVKLKNGNTANVKWYQFRIPITDPDKVVGQITDFNSIRFMRMFVKDFDEMAVLRFGTLDLVRNEWRKYSDELLSNGEYVPDDDINNTSFEVSKVNIEENGKRTPIPYVLPPDIEREVNYSSTTLAKQNEQSMVLKVINLTDGDARAAYKTTEFDFRRYKRLNMYVHAEQVSDDLPLENDETKLFVRLGSDFTENYYEYEIPLKLTSWGASARSDVWPAANDIDLELQALLDAKNARNVLIRESSDGSVNLRTAYTTNYGNGKITVIGTPTLGSVKTIMIGLRNPRAATGSTTDDGQPKSVEVWVNELYVSDFDESGGMAANLVLTSDLADLGNMTLAGHLSTAGFGSIEQKISERQQENIYGYDFATNLELGKLLPEKASVRIPLHFDYSQEFTDPEFSPLNTDIKYADEIATYESKAERDSIKAITREYIQRTNFNLMNVKKMRVGATRKPRLYDIENFDVSYSYSSQFQRNIDIEYDSKKRYKGQLGYNFATVPKNFKPFGKTKIFGKSKSFDIIKDFNFYLLPKQLSFRTDVDRIYNEYLSRNKTNSIIILEPTYVKAFNWNRTYTLAYDLSKALKLDYNAVVQARVDEPAGMVDRDAANWNLVRDSILNSVKNFGRPTNFTHQYSANYTLPINKIPILSWLNVTTKYSGQYMWTTASLATPYLGNTIENSRNIQVNGTANMTNLYNKSKYLKKLLSSGERGKEGFQGRRLNIPVDEVKKDSVEKKSFGKIVLDNTLFLLMSVRNVTVNYTQADGTALPGFINSPRLVGMDLATNSPGWDYIFGSQVDIAERAARNGWITQSDMLNLATITKGNTSLNGRITAEPVKTMKVEINFLRTYSNISQRYVRYDADSGTYNSYNPTSTGNFSISYFTLPTAFVKDNDDYSNANFDNFKDYLLIIANRLAELNGNWLANPVFVTDSLTGIQYPDGYTATQKEVMLYAFQAAYTGKDAKIMKLTPFPSLPMPNWRVTYNGLTKVDFIKRYFKSISISHSYQSTYSVGGFSSNILYDEDADGFAIIRDELGRNYLSKWDMNQILISEQFNPLINFDMTWENSLSTKLSIRRTRNLALSFANNQMTETSSNEIIIGTGYVFKQVPLNLKISGSRRTFKSDVNVKLDLSIRENKIVLRKLVENVDQISSGQRAISINFSADYQMTKTLTFRLFYDHIINDPFVSNQHDNSNINAGISLKFTLAQ